ncbi:putative F-box protein At2g33190 [Musa acuminata AAA Group]|uniref:putative F-box protein At2g33190 n=1 Tax=Musa acuminata AAA Group TaxID=214697 RepID=UPI0031D0E26C
MADWSNLHLDVLNLIFSELSLPDLLRCTVVCAAWLRAIHDLRRCCPKLHHQSPWLAFCGSGGNKGSASDDPFAAHFFSLSEQKVYTIPLPRPPIRYRLFVGSSHGWLITIDKQLQIQLLNPINGAQVNFPSILTYDHIGHILDPWGRIRSHAYNIYYDQQPVEDLPRLNFKAMLSSDPSRGDYIVTLIHYPYGGISFARSSDNKWTTMSLPGLYEDAIFYRDQLYATFDGRVDIWDDLDQEWKTVVPEPELVDIYPFYFPFWLLVQTPSCDLLHVRGKKVLMEEHNDDTETLFMIVYRLDIHNGTSLQVNVSSTYLFISIIYVYMHIC